MKIIETIAELSKALEGSPSIGLVPTMGALHEGHGALISQARKENEVVVVSDFINPLQFNEPSDYENYPRDIDGDAATAERFGADILFAPSLEHMYPGGTPEISVSAGNMGQVLEGASRPGHFDGVVTVVSKLFNIVSPHRAYFGEKDAQQLAIIRRMVADLNFPVEIRSIPIVRGADGLAESSRNLRLSPAQRHDALVLPQAVQALVDGENPESVRTRVRENPAVELDYLKLVDPHDFSEVDSARPGLLALGALWVGPVRLIDARPCCDEQVPDEPHR